MGRIRFGERTPRVVHLDHTTVAGGAELALVRLLNASPAWQPLLLLPTRDDDDAFAELTAEVPQLVRGVAQRSGGSGSSVLGMIAHTARLVAQAVLTRTHRAVRGSDLVVANSTRAAAYGALAMLTSRTPFVLHVRDLVDRESLGGFGYALMTRLILPRADGIIANSRTTLDSARGFLRAGAVGVSIPSAAGIAVASAGAEPRRSGPLRIGMLARIDPWKGQRELLDAFAIAFPEGDEQLELVGGAPFAHENFAVELRARAAELGISDRVVLPGHDGAPAARIATWDIAVQYSTRPEPLGQNVLQYLAGGAATIVAAEGGPVEWVRHEGNGMLVTPRCVPELARTLRQLADDSELRTGLAREGRRTPGLMDDAAVAQAHAAMFAEVIARASARRRRSSAPAPARMAVPASAPVKG